ncbi:MAG: 50S ribosomal protein L4 [Candidatus Uhrbacteria bacterium GW2011_GWE2_45_35]|uniref:Large ribosomal subunit protein uL4 n=2 Tax=Candidatus Uhriibacteriota TaxID=1752732 RepID=A0A0G1LT34_9BACT|nr:MAG: 50S ribosomal protein L4 [Candidatus Uhrbacteria bacterium GW2011_GWF2_44_350]KKU09228.1 MAG: 50S ribosomal protein L4 [Candidatus Uhrbacteria bacterium GW2011_GWE2_45_35]HBR80489.1 50S ribosomal protein L4 [Candidatus Uhrbacteria bacterium]HCU31526.1 50S ribosomal protein L4 [Candidatus Uhrbacteria bacterium]
MVKVKLYNQEGLAVGELELNSTLFGVKIDPAFIHRAVVAYEANTRQVLAHTKGRGEVRGGGRKPWKQKGTGQARHGSRRSPIWVGGGITFGPTNERNFCLKINRVERRKALAMTLSDKVANGKLLVIDSLVLPEAKTKVASAMLKKLPLGRKTLVVIESENKLTPKAVRNIVGINPVSAKSLNLLDVLNNDTVVVSKAAIEILEKTYTK